MPSTSRNLSPCSQNSWPCGIAHGSRPTRRGLRAIGCLTPCDLLAPSTPCVAAISTTRALYRAYKGPLYRVARASDKAEADIGLLPDGYASAAAQDAFCAKTACTIVKIYDQSPNHNHLTVAPPGGAAKGPGPGGYDLPAQADAVPITLAGHKVYGISVPAGVGYRNNSPAHTAVNGQPEGVYMVTSALYLNDKCCFDFGNAETNSLDNQAGHMDAINIMCHDTPCKPDSGLDMEDGIYGNLAVPPIPPSSRSSAPATASTPTPSTRATPNPAPSPPRASFPSPRATSP